MMVKQDGEFVVAKVEENCRVVATQTPMKFLKLGQQKREGKFCLFVYFVYSLHHRMEERLGRERKRTRKGKRKRTLIKLNYVIVY